MRFCISKRFDSLLNSTFFNLKHDLKTPVPITFMFLGINIYSINWQSLKAWLPIIFNCESSDISIFLVVHNSQMQIDQFLWYMMELLHVLYHGMQIQFPHYLKQLFYVHHQYI